MRIVKTSAQTEIEERKIAELRAVNEKLMAQLEYIAVCDHPEMLDEEEE